MTQKVMLREDPREELPVNLTRESIPKGWFVWLPAVIKKSSGVVKCSLPTWIVECARMGRIWARFSP